MNSLRRIRCLLVKEIAQLRRDPRLFGILFLSPLIQILMLGFAATTDVRDIRLGIRDNDRSYHSRELQRAIAASGYFHPRALTGPAAADDDELVSGRASLILEIPHGFGRALEGGRPAPVQVLVDGSDSNFAVNGLNYLRQACARYSADLVAAADARLTRRRGVRLPSVEIETRAWYNPDLLSRLHIVPGLLGVVLLVTTMMVTSMALVKEREDGTMEQLIVTPLRGGEVIAGKLLPFVAVGFAEVSLVVPVILLLFGVPLRGSLVLLYAFSGLFLLTTLGLGLFISTLVRTQQQAMLVAAFFVMMPFVLLSGFIFPVENMPVPIRLLSYAIPLKYYLTIVRGIFLKGNGWRELWPQAAVLLGWGVGILALAVSRFHKRLD